MSLMFVRRGTTGAVIGLMWIAGLYAAEPLVGGFGVVTIAEGVIVRSPGWLSTMATGLLGFYAQPALVVGVCATIVVTTTIVAVGWAQISHLRTPLAVPAGVVATTVLFVATGAGASAGVFAGLLLAIAPPYFVGRWVSNVSNSPSNRREFFRRIGGVTVVGTASMVGLRVLFDRLTGSAESVRVEEPLNRSISPPRGESDFYFRGMPSAVTSPKDHYVVDISVSDPTIDPESWSLTVDGAVDRPYALSYDELLGHEASVSKPRP